MNNSLTDTNLEQEDDEPKSKSQLKREMHALQKLGENLIKLSDNELKKIPLEENLYTAIVDARSMKKEARRRHLQLIGKLMRKSDYEAIEEVYNQFSNQDRQQVQRQHQTELWRDRLLEEGNSTLTEFINQHPNADAQLLRQLLRAANKEQKENKPPASARKLFRYLRELLE